MESLSVRNPLEPSRGRGTCGRRRVTPVRHAKPRGRLLFAEKIPTNLTVRVVEIDPLSKKDDESHK